ncbi:hypothetical protein B0H21DRAFT_894832 [Amylocystis lapponica]|nr:hypothetical protein B0H21DRAFT_894832 [Amylocystis lapponica]
MSVLASACPADPAENWDEDFEFNRHSQSDGRSDTRTNTPLSKDKKNTLRHWTEPGPSTPNKRSLEQPENWDDDFRDGTDSPVRYRSNAREHENWDDDFEERQSHKRKSPRRDLPWGSSSDEDELGFADREDDRTVTSRSRGIPIGLASDIPPVPPLPSSFPRSPSTSVFSMPSSYGGRESSAAYSSTAHLALRPSISGTSSALALLPPSPPIHRERRRLRKKSRPPPNTVDNIYELDDRAEAAARQRSMSPELPINAPPLASSEDTHSEPVPAMSPASKTPLLSRIGSVGKKWGAARRKRTSTSPADVSLQEHRDEPPEQLSRPPSALMSSPPAPAKNGSWFFRTGGGGSGPGSPPAQTTALKHETSVDKFINAVRGPDSPSRKSKLRHRSKRDNASVALPGDISGAVNGDDLPSSMLFLGTPRRPTSMQITASSSSSSWDSRPSSAPRHASYGQSTAHRSRSSSKQRSASASVEDVTRANRSVTIQEDPKHDGERDHGSRRFMGGMRRISLGGSTKHQRTKSSVPADERKRPSTASSVPDSLTGDDQSTPRPPSRVVRSSQDGLLPPIELQPPSPSRLPAGAPVLASIGSQLRPHPSLEPSRSHPTLSSRGRASPLPPPISVTPPASPCTSPLPSPTRPKLSTSPQQAASLGRATQPPKDREAASSVAVPRRNSLGDLKIPPRISQAQVGLRRDLGMVREFAASVEQLKQLLATYSSLLGEVQAAIHSTQPAPSRAISPNLFNTPKPAAARARSNTNPVSPLSYRELTTAFHHIEAKYQLSWECAELLIELGGGGGPASEPPTSPPPHATISASSAAPPTPIEGRKSRERAITLAGDEPKPIVAASPSTLGSPPLASPPSTYWRASTGRHDLSHRQLLLLREMLNTSDSSTAFAPTVEPRIPEEEHVINRNWRWGDAMNSTVTLPSEESAPAAGNDTTTGKRRRGSRLGMKGLRDMLKSLKKSYSEGPPLPALPPIPASSTSVSASTDSSSNLAAERPPSALQRRRAKTSTGPESMKSVRERDRAREKHPNSPYGTAPSLTHRASPRRPSLASIFRLGQKHKSALFAQDSSSDDLKGSARSGSGRTSRTGLGDDEEDWDRIESSKGKSPYVLQQQQQQQQRPQTPPTASQSSLRSADPSPRKAPAPPSLHTSRSARAIHLHALAEADALRQTQTQDRALTPSPSPQRPVRRGGPFGSVRSAPPQGYSPGPLPDPKLAMTPENIQPLLENAREVQLRCCECIGELQALLPAPAGALP